MILTSEGSQVPTPLRPPGGQPHDARYVAAPAAARSPKGRSTADGMVACVQHYFVGMPWWTRVAVAGVLILTGALFVTGSRAVGWVTSDKSSVRINECREVVEDPHPGLRCYGDDGRAVVGADRQDVGQRIEVVRVLGLPGQPDAEVYTYTWSGTKSAYLALGIAASMLALITLAWPAVPALLRRRRTVRA
jgi:hypothetical protein